MFGPPTIQFSGALSPVSSTLRALAAEPALNSEGNELNETSGNWSALRPSYVNPIFKQESGFTGHGEAVVICGMDAGSPFTKAPMKRFAAATLLV